MGVLVADLRELMVLRSRQPGEFVLRHRRAGALFSGPGVAEEGSLLWRLGALDAALRDLRLPTLGGEWLPLGLYNPYTREVAVGPTPVCRAFGGDVPLRFDVPLLEGVVSGDELALSGRVLAELRPSFERARRTVLV